MPWRKYRKIDKFFSANKKRFFMQDNYIQNKVY